jgi:hypothetical protein
MKNNNIIKITNDISLNMNNIDQAAEILKDFDLKAQDFKNPQINLEIFCDGQLLSNVAKKVFSNHLRMPGVSVPANLEQLEATLQQQEEIIHDQEKFHQLLDQSTAAGRERIMHSRAWHQDCAKKGITPYNNLVNYVESNILSNVRQECQDISEHQTIWNKSQIFRLLEKILSDSKYEKYFDQLNHLDIIKTDLSYEVACINFNNPVNQLEAAFQERQDSGETVTGVVIGCGAHNFLRASTEILGQKDQVSIGCPDKHGKDLCINLGYIANSDVEADATDPSLWKRLAEICHNSLEAVKEHSLDNIFAGKADLLKLVHDHVLIPEGRLEIATTDTKAPLDAKLAQESGFQYCDYQQQSVDFSYVTSFGQVEQQFINTHYYIAIELSGQDAAGELMI